MIYFDNAATTMRKPPQVSEAVLNSLEYMGNSGRGAHGATLGASRVIYGARERLGELLGIASPERIAFTSNATEALNTAISGMLKEGDHVITTECEHNSVLRPLYRKEKEGVSLTIIPTVKGRVQQHGILDYSLIEKAVRPNTKAIVITHASNLTGNITDLNYVSNVAKKHGLLLVVDASQSAGVLPLNVKEMGIDVLCFTGHKGLLGPQGTGGLYVREGIEIHPLKVGGSGVHSYDREHPSSMPTALEAGTLNGHGIAGLYGALGYLLETGIESVRRAEMALLERFLEGIKNIPGIVIYGNPDLNQRVATVALNVRDYDSGEIADWLWEDYEIAVRPGAHCAPLMHEALGTREQGAVRFSFSHYNTKEEVDLALQALREYAKE